MTLSISKAVKQIKGDVVAALPADVIQSICHQLGHRWRERTLDPVTTTHAFLLQILHGNVACDAVPHLMGKTFTGGAYCQARSRLPLELFQHLLTAMCRVLRRHSSSDWHGHRVWLVDGSSCSMPDTKELQQAFGQPGTQRKGCGFPMAHLLTLFDFHTGFLIKISAAPLRTHDMSQVTRMHAEMQRGDVLLGDRGFCSYAHLAMLDEAGIHGLFRIHQKTNVSFEKGRPHRPQSQSKKQSYKKGLPASRWIKTLGRDDQIVECFKPNRCPDWMTQEANLALPESLMVRELCYRITQKGRRTREVLLVTTLLDSERYSAKDLAGLYASRWKVETNLRHLKQTLGMDVLHAKTLNNVMKELAMFAVVYNLVRLVMIDAAEQQQVPVERISFIDALRWLRHAQQNELSRNLVNLPHRPNRYEPRVKKRRAKGYDLMNKPRKELRKRLVSQNFKA